ncbi:MAG: type III-A CRISPR-associated RAMP protein Csm4 [Candidatus Desulfofervidus auxilii]|nr:type III-A CRISPR-associated RAMP protein Csm4 [Candidatus Desulfofervidus auxilii]
MQTYAVYLYPKSSFTTWPASDTLFGAFCWAIFHLYGKKRLKETLSAFIENSPPFILSSSFPCVFNSDRKIHFFPKPLLPDPDYEERKKLIEKQKRIGEIITQDEVLNFNLAFLRISERLKDFKRIRYVSENIFWGMIKGNFGYSKICFWLKKRGSIKTDIEKYGFCLITTEERRQIDPEGELIDKYLFKEIDIQKNQIDRISFSTGEGFLFFRKEIFFHTCCGLWFLIKTKDKEFIHSLLRFLADTGIGGERTAGKGHFRFQIEKYEPPAVQNPNVFITLSRYVPVKDEIDLSLSLWNILNLRAKLDTLYSYDNRGIFKKLIRCFEEGSLFTFLSKKESYGKLIAIGKIGQDDTFYDGIAFPIFAKIEVSKKCV